MNNGVLRLKLPAPYPLQREIIDAPYKRKVVVAGRRAGKTHLAALMASERFLRGQRVLIGSLTQRQSDIFWFKIRRWLAPLFALKLVTKNEVTRTIDGTAIGLGLIHVRTASQPDHIIGDNYDLIIFDECALLDPLTWFQAAQPMLIDTDGDALFISSPRRKNWFYKLYLKGKDGDNTRWHSWKFTSYANPHLSKELINELKEDMPGDIYEQEILAEFLDAQGLVFRNYANCVFPDFVSKFQSDPKYVMGVDWAREKDFTVVSVMDIDTNEVIEIDRFNKISWSFQRGRLKALAHKYKPEVILAESNSIGSPNIELLQGEGLPVYPFYTTIDSKARVIESLALAFERNAIRIPEYSPLLAELEAFEMRQLQSGRIQYSAPDGYHDDCVISLALTWRACLAARYARSTGKPQYLHFESKIGDY